MLRDSRLGQLLKNRIDLKVAPAGGWATKIDRRSELSVEDFVTEYLNPRQPVLITDAAKAQNWKALEWTPASLKAKLGSRPVPVGDEIVPFDQFIDRMLREPSAPYLSNVDIPKYFPELLPDFRPPLKYAGGNRLLSPLIPPNFPTHREEKLFVTFFVGPRGRTYGLHYDFFNVHTFITQLHGTKDFRFYSPDQSEYMYPNVDHPKVSDVNDPWTPDFERYPLFRKARGLEFTANPGDTLFVPAGWWHTTRLGDQSISIGESFVHSANWMHFVQDIAVGRGRSVAKRVAAATYLLGAGAVMSVEERLGLQTISGKVGRLLAATPTPVSRISSS